MVERYELRNMVEAEQIEFGKLLRGLTPDQWETPSLCAKWTVHETVIHIAMHAHTNGRERVGDALRGLRRDEDPSMTAGRGRSTDELIAYLESPARLGSSRFDILTQLSELVIHQQDVRRPLGADRTIPADRLGVVLDFGVAVGGLTWTMAFSRRRAKGLRLVAPDINWSVGLGPEVRGPGEAILMALNGRTAALSDLEGDGVPVLAGRMP